MVIFLYSNVVIALETEWIQSMPIWDPENLFKISDLFMNWTYDLRSWGLTEFTELDKIYMFSILFNILLYEARRKVSVAG